MGPACCQPWNTLQCPTTLRNRHKQHAAESAKIHLEVETAQNSKHRSLFTDYGRQWTSFVIKRRRRYGTILFLISSNTEK